MQFTEPFIATKVHNPLNVTCRYSWLGDVGMELYADQTAVMPYDVYTAARPELRAQIAADVRGGRVKLTYLVRGIEVEQVKSLATGATLSAVEESKPGKPKKTPAVSTDHNDIIVEDVSRKLPKEKTFAEATGWENQPGLTRPEEDATPIEEQREAGVRGGTDPGPKKKRSTRKKKSD